jgi:hypothetical protein
MSVKREQLDPTQKQVTKDYLGIDFACIKKNEGNCLLRDDGTTLRLDFSKKEQRKIVCTAVDCPLGTASEFLDLLAGNVPANTSDESLATRATERWLRQHVSNNYKTASMWNETARKRYGRPWYFQETAHVQPTIAMRIVPKCLYWLLKKQGQQISSKSGLAILQEARKGTGKVIEAHPRMFLYSAVEKQHRLCPSSVTLKVLFHAAEYKNAKKHRRFVYHFLQQNTEWLQPCTRILMPKKPPKKILDSNHAFDAFLSALTAWSHLHRMTIRWDQTTPRLSEDAVLQEGHILVLAEKEQAHA